MVKQQEIQSLVVANSAVGLIVIDGAPFSHPMIQLMNFAVPIVIIDAHQAQQQRLTRPMNMAPWRKISMRNPHAGN